MFVIFSVTSSATFVWTVVIVSTRFEVVTSFLTQNEAFLAAVGSLFLFVFVFVCVFVVLGESVFQVASWLCLVKLVLRKDS